MCAYTRLPLTTWFLALHLVTQTKNNISALERKRYLGVSYRTALRLKHKPMQAMVRRAEARQLAGFVQIDDAYLGGERNVGEAGRGSQNKRSFVIAVETDERGHPRCAVTDPVSGCTKAALVEWFTLHMHPDADVFSDGLGAFRAAADLGHVPTVIDAGGGRTVTETPGARWVTITLSNLKRPLDGSYHVFGFSSTPIATSPKRLGASIDVSNSMSWCLACWSPPRVAPMDRTPSSRSCRFCRLSNGANQELILFCASGRRGRGRYRGTDEDGLDR